MGYIKNWFVQILVTKAPKKHTILDNTRTYPLVPEASSAANFADIRTETFVNGLFFSVEDLGGVGGVEEAGDDSSGGGGGGEATGMGDSVTPTFRFRCISKSPTYHKATNAWSNIGMCKQYTHSYTPTFYALFLFKCMCYRKA